MPFVRDDLGWLSALDLARLIRDKEVSPAEVMTAVLARIDAPQSRAERLLHGSRRGGAATSPPRRRSAVLTGEELGPLHGVPVSIKDLVFTRRMRTTAGSRLFADHVPEEDAVAVERLAPPAPSSWARPIRPSSATRASPTIRSSAPPATRGIPRSPPAAPSGGAGAAIAAGLAPLALGTDGGGSIRIPASFCGIYGLKPSFGRVPWGPGLPGSDTLAHTGPMTRTVRDAALMLDALAGPDDRDRHSLPADGGASLPRGLRRGHRRALGGVVRGSRPRPRGSRGGGRLRGGGGAVRVARLPRGGRHAHVGRPRGDLPDPGQRGGLRRLPRSPRRERAPARSVVRRAPAHGRADHRGAVPGRGASPARLWTEVHRFLARFDLLITPTLAVAAFPIGASPIREIAGQPDLSAGLDALHVPFQPHRPAGGERARWASPRRACRWGSRSWAGAMPIGRCSPPPPRSRRRSRGGSAGRPASEPARLRLLLICFGGACGTAARYGVDVAAIALARGRLPYGTLMVNVLGSFLIGVIQEVALSTTLVPETLRLVLAVGVMGGFTTYSAFSYRRSASRSGAPSPAALNVLLTTGLCLGACVLGLLVGRALAAPR